MQESVEELEATYREFSDSEIASLAVQPETLTEVAQGVLAAEIKRRGLSSADLEKQNKKDLHHEARFDQLQRMRRKNLLMYLLTRNDPKGTIAVVLIGFFVVFLMWLRGLLH